MAYTDIDKPTDYFNTKLFTGNGSSNAISGVGFQPDWIWFKNRTSAQSHAIVDSVRGRKGLQSNVTDAEYTLNSGKDFGTFDSDGFTVLTPEQLNSFNYNTGSIVSWNWKAGTSFTNDASATGIGSIDSSGSVNTTAGFSICTYTGTGSVGTIKHGLNTKPDVIICKSRSGAEEWRPYFSVLGATKGMRLNGTNAEDTDSAYWNNTEPTSSVFTVGTNGGTNGSSVTTVAYCFSSIKGYSKFGSYTGNGNADGPFIWTGFKPAFVLQKNASATQGWQLQDNKREGYNGDNDLLQPHDSATESGVNRIDILSNGFKVITTDAGQNSSGATYIYMAFAESPFVNSNGVPNNAR
jgi:hypothetical protein